MIDVTPDQKRPARIKDPDLMRRLHIRWRFCALCGRGASQRSLHHIYPKGQGGDDVEACLVMFCGHGTAGCHGRIEAHDRETMEDFRDYIDRERSDFIEYLDAKLGGLEQALAWLDRYVAPA